MLLRSIEYKNFRPFIGVQKINLLPNEDNTDANVVVILGDNTYGKSTFVLSFIWCLYGESRFTRAADILNKKVESRMKYGSRESAYVEIVFEDDGRLYTMRRTQNFSMGQNGSLHADDAIARLMYVDENGETKQIGPSVNDIALAIKSILPKDLSSFFFFEGEKNNEISKKDLGKSVKTLLGLEAIDNMRNHLHGTTVSPSAESVLGYYQSKQSDSSNIKAQAEWNKKVKAEGELDSINTRITEIDDQIHSYEAELEQINESLRQAEPSKELQKRRDALQTTMKDQEEELGRAYNSFLRSFSQQSFELLMYPLLEKAMQRLSQMEIEDKGIKGIEAPAISELLKRGVCLCGRPLKEGTPSYDEVKSYYDYIPPQNVGNIVREMFDSINECKGQAEDYVLLFNEGYSAIQRINTRIDNYEKEDRDLLAEIQRIGLKNTDNLESNYRDYKSRISNLRQEKETKIADRQRKISEIDTAEKNYNAQKNKSKQAQEYQVYYQYAEQLYEWANKDYIKKEASMKTRLAQYVSELFNNMYSGHREIRIDDKYNLVMTYDGRRLDDTGGLRVIQYFAYVGGLVKLAKEVMLERETDDEGNSEGFGEQYPLVLDAAFSHADAEHTKSISKELSNSVGQLVFALMEKDWLYAKDGMIGKVGRMYRLNKIDETEVQIEEVM